MLRSPRSIGAFGLGDLQACLGLWDLEMGQRRVSQTTHSWPVVSGLIKRLTDYDHVAVEGLIRS